MLHDSHNEVDPYLATREALRALFEVLPIDEFYCVDDLFSINLRDADVVAYCDHLGAKVNELVSEFSDVDMEAPEEIWKDQVTQIWEGMSESRQSLAYQILRREAGDEEGELDNAHELDNILAPAKVRKLSLGEWEGEKDKVLKEAKQKRTLILFDQDFSKERDLSFGEHGIELVKEAIGCDGNIVCGLLSHMFNPENEREHWQKISEAHDIDNSRFILISKDRLVTDPIGFARMVKLNMLNAKLPELKKSAFSIIRDVQQESIQKVSEIDIYDFEHIVFKSSFNEGVWEPDTLFRIFEIHQRSQAEKKARLDPLLINVVDGVRKISRVKTDSGSTDNTWSPLRVQEIRHLELYEDGDINAYYAPVALGDIFVNEANSKKYVLVAQPCDLMVRYDGKRNPFIKDAYLVEIRPGSISVGTSESGNAEAGPFDRDLAFELPCLQTASDMGSYTNEHVQFKRRYSVSLDILDLCAFNDSGRVWYKRSSQCPRAVIPNWQKRYGYISKTFDKAISKYIELKNKGLKDEDARLVMPISTVDRQFKADVNMGSGEIDFGLKRVMRLRSPLADALLTRLSLSLARAAFDHDYTAEFEE